MTSTKQTRLRYTPSHPLQDQLLKLCHSVPLRRHVNRLGPKLWTEYQRVALVTLFRRSRRSLRDFIAQLPELRWPSWLQLRELPSKSTLHAWCQRFTTSFARLLNKLLLHKEEPHVLAIDATGVDSWQRSRHYERRVGEAPLPYAKLDLLVDAERLLIHDVVGARSRFRRTRLRDALILANKGYDCEWLHALAVEKGNRLFAPVRESARPRPRGAHRRRCTAGHPAYHQRNSVESVNHSLKRRFLPSLRSKLAHMKKRETAWHVLNYNLERLRLLANAIARLLAWLSQT